MSVPDYSKMDLTKVDPKSIEILCPFCLSRMEIMPLLKSASCTKCTTRLALDKVEFVRKAVENDIDYKCDEYD